MMHESFNLPDMRIILLFLLIFCSSLLQAQIGWLQTGQQWEYCSVLGWVGEIGCGKIVVGGDTIISGKACKKIGASAYAYEISDKVFVCEDGVSFQKVYDFDMIEGETLDIGFFTYQVDSIFAIDLDDFTGVRIQMAHIVGAPFKGISTFYIAEGIGFIKNLQLSESEGCACGSFFPSALTCDFYLDGQDTYLSWFREDNKIYIPASSLNCQGTLPVSSPIASNIIRLEPSLVTSTCRLVYSSPPSAGILTLMNVAGTVVQQWQGTPDMLDFVAHPPGLYILVLHDNDRMVWSGKIIKQ